jgi:hypothetical protein
MRSEVLNKAFNPLIAYRDSRCQNQGWLINPADSFQAEYSFSGARCSYDVQPLVLEIQIKPL